MKRQRSTPAETAAKLQSKLEKINSKLALKSALSDPILAPLVETRNAVEQDHLFAIRGLSKGPQNFDLRIRQHELWIDEIQAAKRYAEMLKDYASATIDAVNKEIQRFAARIAAGDPPTEDEVTNAVYNLPTGSGELRNAQVDYQQAVEARKVSTMAKVTDPSEINAVLENSAGE